MPMRPPPTFRTLQVSGEIIMVLFGIITLGGVAVMVMFGIITLDGFGLDLISSFKTAGFESEASNRAPLLRLGIRARMAPSS